MTYYKWGGALNFTELTRYTKTISRNKYSVLKTKRVQRTKGGITAL